MKSFQFYLFFTPFLSPYSYTPPPLFCFFLSTSYPFPLYAINSSRLLWGRQHSKGARSFRGQKILQPSHPDALFPQKKFFSCRPQNAGHKRRFTVKIKQIDLKRSDMVTFLFFLHTVTEAKQYAGLGRAKPGRWIFRPGHLTWRALV